MKIYFISQTVVFDFKNERLVTENCVVNIRHNEALLLNLLLNGVEAKNDLISKIWPNGATSESSYYKIAHDLRRSLVNVGLPIGIIKTIPRKGFRFVGDVNEISSVSDVFPKELNEAVTQDSPFTPDVLISEDEILDHGLTTSNEVELIDQALLVGATAESNQIERNSEIAPQLSNASVDESRSQSLPSSLFRADRTVARLYLASLFIAALVPFCISVNKSDTKINFQENRNGVMWTLIGGIGAPQIAIDKDVDSVYVRSAKVGQAIYLCKSKLERDSCESYYFLR